MKPSIIAPGLYFSDSDLILRETKKEVGLTKGTTKAEAMGVLISSLERNDSELTKISLEFLGSDSVSMPGAKRNITKKLGATRELSHDILNALDQSGAIDLAQLLIEMNSNRNWGWAGWLLRDRESIERTENNLPDDHTRQIHGGGHRRSAALLLDRLIRAGGAREAAGLDITYIIRGLVPRNQHEGVNLFLAAIGGNANSVEDIANLTEVLWKPETYALLNPGLEKYEIQWQLIENCCVVFKQILNDDDLHLSTANRMEKIAELSPSLADAMGRYWDLPLEALTKNHAGKWTSTDHDRISERLPGISPPHYKDLLDCAIRTGSAWVEDALLAGGKLHDAVLERLENDKGPLMAGLILGFRPDAIHLYVPKLVKTFGKDWKDDHGRGIGHYLVRASNTPTENMLRAILRTNLGVSLLADMDNGKSALSFLEEHEDWRANKRKLELIKKAKHKVLAHISKKVSVSRPEPRAIHF